jgi:hypothetical protein
MNDLIASISDPDDSSQRADAEIKSGLVFLDDLQRDERFKQRIESIVRSWPIFVGLILAFFAPVLSEVVGVFKPWGMWLVFPFVSLAMRPELHFSGRLGEIVPQAVLFLQFPMEAYFAKKFLRGRVTFSGVAGQIFLYHFLGVAQLFLVCRALGDGSLR